MDLNQWDFVTLLTKSLGLQKRAPGVLDPRVQVGLTLDDLTAPEYLFLRGMRSFQGRASRAATAGNLNYTTLQGAANLLAVVDEITIVNTNAALAGYKVGLSVANANMTNGAIAVRDGRLVGVSSACSLYSGTAVGPTSPEGLYVQVDPGQMLTIRVPYVLAKNVGTALQVVSTIANQTTDIAFRWRERALLPSEE